MKFANRSWPERHGVTTATAFRSSNCFLIDYNYVQMHYWDWKLKRKLRTLQAGYINIYKLLSLTLQARRTVWSWNLPMSIPQTGVEGGGEIKKQQLRFSYFNNSNLTPDALLFAKPFQYLIVYYGTRPVSEIDCNGFGYRITSVRQFVMFSLENWFTNRRSITAIFETWNDKWRRLENAQWKRLGTTNRLQSRDRRLSDEMERLSLGLNVSPQFHSPLYHTHTHN